MMDEEDPLYAYMEHALQNAMVQYREMDMQLEGTMKQRIAMAERIDTIEKSLPGLDCGSCGSPTCRALAYDIAHGYANELNCIFKLNDRIGALAAEMVTLGASTRFNTLQDTARLNEMKEALTRDDDTESSEDGDKR